MIIITVEEASWGDFLLLQSLISAGMADLNGNLSICDFVLLVQKYERHFVI